MRKILSTLVFLSIILISRTGYAQTIFGNLVSDSIIAVPGDYKCGIKNSSWLILGAEQETPVIAPRDGILISFRFVYWHSFNEFVSWNVRRRTLKEQDEQLAAIASELEVSQQFINAFVTIASEESEVSIAGFKPHISLKVGDAIKKGDTLGFVDYFSPLIQKPAIAIATSGRNNQDDLYQIVGLRKRSYSPTFPSLYRYSFSVAEMQDELDIVYSLLAEVNPNLYDYRSIESLDSLYQALRIQTSRPLLYQDYAKRLEKLVQFVHDPSTTLQFNPYPNDWRELYLYPILFGVLGDSLVVTHNFLELDSLNGTTIRAIEGEATRDIVSYIRSQVRNGDVLYNPGGKSDGLFQLTACALGSEIYYRGYASQKLTNATTLVGGDNRSSYYAQLPPEKGYFSFLPPNFASYFSGGNDDSIRMQILASKIAYLALPRLDFDSAALVRVENFLDSVATFPFENLVIDLRYCQNGTIENVEVLFSHLAEKSFLSYLWCDISKHLSTVQDRYLTAQWQKLSPLLRFQPTLDENRLRATNTKLCQPTSTPFKGNVYVLINEFTQSVPTLLPALVRREQRGVIIGRETNSPYHILSAQPVVQYSLPHSHFVLSVPLLKIYFDTLQEASNPYGRGVIPDYRIGFSIRELTGQCTDSILAFTTTLIEKGEKQSDFEIFWTLRKILVSAWILAVVFILYFTRRYTRRLSQIRQEWLRKNDKTPSLR